MEDRLAKIRLTAENSDLQKGLGESNKAFGAFQKTVESVQANLGKLPDHFKKTLESGAKLRKAFGEDVRALDAYEKAVTKFGQAQEKVVKGFGKFQETFGKTGKAAKDFSGNLTQNVKDLDLYNRAANQARQQSEKFTQAIARSKFGPAAQDVYAYTGSLDELSRAATNAGQQSTAIVRYTGEANQVMAETAEQSVKAASGMRQFFGAMGEGLKAFGWIANAVQVIGIMKTGLDGLSQSATQFFAAFTGGGLERIPEVLSLMQSVGVSTASVEQLSLLQGAITGNTEAVKGFGLASVSSYTQFEAALTQVNTIYRRNKDELDALGDSIQGMVNGPLKNMVSSVEALNGQYQVLSAGFTETAESQQVLNAGLKLSVVGYNDSSSTLSLLVKTMQAYGFESNRALQTAAELNGIVEYGITTIPELAQTFGATATVANQAGLKINELGAAVAALTAKGSATPEALTGIESLMRTIISKTPQAEKALAKLSAEAGKAIRFDTRDLKERGLAVMLQELNEATKGNITLLREVIPDSLAYSTALGLMSENGAKFKETLEGMDKATTDNFNSVFEDIAADRQKRLEAIANRAQELLIEFGRSLVPMFEGGIKTLEGLLNVIDKIPFKGAIAQTILFTLAAKQFAGGLGTLAGTALKVTQQIIAFRAINLLFSGELFNEIKIIKHLVVAQNNWAGAMKQAVGLNRNRAQSLQDAIAWEKESLQNQEGLFASLKRKIFMRNQEKAADAEAAAATQASAAADTQASAAKATAAKASAVQAQAEVATTTAIQTRTAAVAQGIAAEQGYITVDVQSTAIKTASATATQAQAQADVVHATTLKGKIAALWAESKAQATNTSGKVADQTVTTGQTAANTRFLGVAKVKLGILLNEAKVTATNTAIKVKDLVISKGKAAAEGLELTAKKANVLVTALMTKGTITGIAAKAADAVATKAQATVNALSATTVKANIATTGIFTKALWGKVTALWASTQAQIANSGAGAALTLTTKGLAMVTGLLSKAAMFAAKAMLAMLANPLVLAGIAVLTPALLILRELFVGTAADVRKANKSLDEIIKTAASAEDQFTKTSEAFKGLQKEFTRDGRKKSGLTERERERAERDEARVGRRQESFEGQGFRGDRAELLAKSGVGGRNPFAMLTSGGLFNADNRNAIFAGNADLVERVAAIPQGGREKRDANLAAKDQAVQDAILGFETTASGTRGRSMTGFRNDDRTQVAGGILPTVDRLNKGFGITQEVTDKVSQGQAITGEDVEAERKAYEEIKAPLEAYIAGKEKELEATKNPERRAAIAKEIADMNEVADGYKAAYDQGQMFLQTQNQVNQIMKDNEAGAGNDFTKSFASQLEAAEGQLDEVFKMAEEGVLDDITKLEDSAARYAEMVATGFEEGVEGFQTSGEVADKLRTLRDRTITRTVEGKEVTQSALTPSMRREITGQIAEVDQQSSDERIKIIQSETALLQQAQATRLGDSRETQALIRENNMQVSQDQLETLETQISAFKEYGRNTVNLEQQAAQLRSQIKLQELDDTFAAFDRDSQRRIEAIQRETSILERTGALGLGDNLKIQEQIQENNLKIAQDQLSTLDQQIQAAKDAGESTVDLEEQAARAREDIRLQELGNTFSAFERDSQRRIALIQNETSILERTSALGLGDSLKIQEQVQANNLKIAQDNLSTLEQQIQAAKDAGESTVDLENKAAQAREAIRLQELGNTFSAFERDSQRRVALIQNETRQTQIALAEKTISQEEAAQQASAASIAESQSELQLIDDRIATAKAANEDITDLEKTRARVLDEIRLKQISEEERLYQRRLTLQKMAIQNELDEVKLGLQAQVQLRIGAAEEAFRLEGQLIDSRNSLARTQAEQEINNLQARQQLTADGVESAKIGIQLAEAQARQQETAVQIDRERLVMDGRMNVLAMEREQITNQIAQLENQVAQQKLTIELADARRNKADKEEIDALENQLALVGQQSQVLGQQADQIQNTISAQAELTSNAEAELNIRASMVAQNGAMSVQEAKIQAMSAELEKQQQLMAERIRSLDLEAARMQTILNARQQSFSLEQNMLSIRQGIFESTQAYIQGEYDILIKSETSAKRRRKLEKEAGDARLEMLRQSQEMERMSLEMNIRQRDLALERKKIENETARAKNAAEIQSAQAEIERQKALRDAGKATDADVRAAQAGLQGSIAQGAGLGVEQFFLGQEGQLNQIQATADRSNLNRSQGLQSDQALMEYMESLPNGAEKRRLQRQFSSRDAINTRQGNARSAMQGMRENLGQFDAILQQQPPSFEAMYDQLAASLGGGPTPLSSMEAQFSAEVNRRSGGLSPTPTGPGAAQGQAAQMMPIEVVAANTGIIAELLKGIHNKIVGAEGSGDRGSSTVNGDSNINIVIEQHFGEGSTQEMADDAKRQMIEMLRRDRQEIEQAGRGG